MSAALRAPFAGPSFSSPAVQEFWTKFRKRLGDRRFWYVQVMVIGVTVSHTLSEAFSLIPGDHHGTIYFLPASLYFFPVLYASLNFGREGAMPTAIWSAFLSVPNIIIWHEGIERLGEAFQLGIIVILATVVATRVDREIAARQKAEEQEGALRLSEMRYHSLFDSAGQAIIVFDRSAVIHEANYAASALFGRSIEEMKGASLDSIIGPSATELRRLPSESDRAIGKEFSITTEDGEVWLEPVCTAVPGANSLVLGLFRDVTAQRGFQSYAREIVRAQEEERQRIARELHDASLQSVVLLCRHLDAVEEAASDRSPPAAAEALYEARVLAEGIGAELRRFSRDLRPSILDDLGLVPAIRSLIGDLSTRSGIKGRFELTGDPVRLSSITEVSLFRITQEGLRNVERHSSASRVIVRLQFRPDSIRLTISDNGRGFQMPSSTTNLASAGRLGLLGMQERASLAGGTWQLYSRPGRGTRIVVTLADSSSRQVNRGPGLLAG